ncbi:MAG TPA: DUF2298 domain-containing protein [Methanospirillum sp.]|nr:DUF2298 domain-containing protein [Methanospirillum sp.]
MYTPIDQVLFVVRWLIVITVLHFACWPPLRSRLPADISYPISYMLSLLLCGIGSWWLSLLKIPPLLIFLPFMVLFAFYLLTGQYSREVFRSVVWWDGLFLVFFMGMLITRLKNSAIYANERFLDMGIIASIMRNPVVTPLDPHYAGGVLDIYYYFSHWIFSIIGLAGQVPPTVVYNLILPTIVGLSALFLYGIGRMIIPRFAFLPLFIMVVPTPSLGLLLLNGGWQDFTAALEKSVDVIPGVGSNYPLHELLRGIPHPHVTACANQIFLLFLVIATLYQWTALGKAGKRVLCLIMGLSAGVIFTQNTWDLFVYYPLVLGVVGYLVYQDTRSQREPGEYWDAGITLACLLAPMAFVILPYLFQMHIKGLQGIGIVTSPSNLWLYILVHGLILLPLVWYLRSDILAKPYVLIFGIILGLLGYASAGLLLILITYLILKLNRCRYDILMAFSLLVLLLTEIVYFQETGDPLSRFNTVFKLSLAAWPLLWVSLIGIGAPWLAALRSGSDSPRRSLGFVTLACILILVALVAAPVEPIFSIFSLDGAAYMEIHQPEDAVMIEMIRQDPGAVCIAEAVGDFDYYARIASFTGVPAIIGWPSVEGQWRGDREAIGERVLDVERLYTDPSATMDVLRKYNCSYMVISNLEVARYKNVSISPDGLEPVYAVNNSALIRVLPVQAG